MTYVACFKCKQFFHREDSSNPRPDRCDHDLYWYSRKNQLKRDAEDFESWDELKLED